MKYCPNDKCPHYIRTGEFSEYYDKIKKCADCDTPLISLKDERYSKENILENKYKAKWEILDTYHEFDIAEQDRNLLELSDIPALVKEHESTSIFQWVLTLFIGNVKLLVPEKFIESAKETLTNYELIDVIDEGIDLPEELEVPEDVKRLKKQ